MIRESGNPDAPLLVFVHGGGVASWMWERQLAYFNHYHCLALDLPGHGQRIGESFSIRDSACELLELIQAKGKGKKIILTGFSLGAQVAIQMLGQDSETIDYAVINSALTKPLPAASRMIGPTVKLTSWLARKRWFSKLQANQLYIGDELFARYYEHSLGMEPDTLVQVLQENMSFAIPEGYRHSKARILVTVGEKERKIMRESAFDLVRARPDSRGIVIPGVGHGLSLSRPDLFNRILEAWCTEEELPDGLPQIQG
ncbi:alpha/beta fold hydrolase [Cohnella boryungensis]|uniref:Alpha/beta fold hydrolase n=1 Tax=Cohnella boryungensis TaxID=768479 RepID=A0ABV8SLP8_9BACL